MGDLERKEISCESNEGHYFLGIIFFFLLLNNNNEFQVENTTNFLTGSRFMRILIIMHPVGGDGIVPTSFDVDGNAGRKETLRLLPRRGAF